MGRRWVVEDGKTFLVGEAIWIKATTEKAQAFPKTVA